MQTKSMSSLINTVSLEMAESLANQLKVDHNTSSLTVLQYLCDAGFKAVFPLADLHVVFCIFQETVRPFLHFANQLVINGCSGCTLALKNVCEAKLHLAGHCNAAKHSRKE